MKRLILAATALVGLMGCYSTARAADPITVCTAGKDGLYYGAAQFLAQASGAVKIIPLETAGSWQDLIWLAEGTKCQAAIVQGDSVVAFQRTHGAEARNLRRASALYREYVHVICNRKANVSGVYDLVKGDKKGLAVGADGSGGWITMQNWIAADKAFGKVPVLSEGGDAAAGMIADEGGEASCMLFVAGLKTSAVNKINDQYGDAEKLVQATADVFSSAKDERGKPLYEMGEIPAGTYPKLQPTGMFGGSKGLSVPTERAVLVVNMDALGHDRFTMLMEALGKSRARIMAAGGESN